MEWADVFDQIGDGLNRAMEAINRGLLAVLGNSNERAVRKLRPNVAAINALEPKMQALSDEELRDQTRIFRARLADGETLDDLSVEAFAACREAGRRYMKMRHYDVQLLGGMVLHSGRIAEMVTGEGKTLVATLPAYLNALEGRGVHVVTVNDYLARRDAEWNSPLFRGLGLTVGAIQSSMDPHERKPEYACDITYGTNNEFGFDYLRDNMKPTHELQCQRELRYAIIDEVDSILIDEARTPLIISGPAIDDPTKYSKANRVALQLKRDVHFEVKEKEHTCHLTDEGVLEAERLVGVESFYTAGNMEWPHLIDNALKANYLYKRDKEYVIEGGNVVIVDEHTGRKMEGRQWSDGLHQAVEAKEGVKIKEETQTLATITFQNFFKLYHKISGMTGTAMTEANEFYKIYKLDVVAIPTNRPLIRENYPDVIFCTQKEKWKAVVDEVKRVHRTGRPVLVGTTSVEKSEHLSEIFKRGGIQHEVLNAKYVEREAEIVAQAGRRGMVTIATNMAGRGTDIILGGNPETKAWSELKHKYATRLDVPPEEWRAAIEPHEEPMKREGREIARPRTPAELAKELKVDERWAAIFEGASRRRLEDPERLADDNGVDPKDRAAFVDFVLTCRAAAPGGLHIVGTERHESRRIDNQLRGRAGRQGDPGSSRFYLSLEDDLMRIFAGDWVRGILQRLGMKDGEAIESRMVSRRIEGAQKKVEERNFEIRKSLLEYDEIMDTQRKRVYGFRQGVLEGDDTKRLIFEMIDHQAARGVENFLGAGYGQSAFAAWAAHRLGVEMDPKDFHRADFSQAEQIAREEAVQHAESLIADQIEENLGEEVDPKEWNWEAIASFAYTRWGLKLKSYDLKRLGRDGVEKHILQLARKEIESVSLEAGAEFFQEDFGLRSLIGWANQKFALDVSLDEVPRAISDDKEGLAEFLRQKARERYLRKEIEFPVLCGMSRFLADKQAQATARYDREGLVAWAERRFESPVDLEEMRSLTRGEVRDRLIGLSRSFLEGAAKLANELTGLIEETCPGADATELSNEQVDRLLGWARQRLEREIDLGPAEPTKARVRRALFAALDQRNRPELREAERVLLLQFLDSGWKDHLYAMDHLRSGIGLVGYAQIDPKVEYKRKGKQLFSEMWESFENRVTDLVFRVEEVDPSFVSHLWQITNVTHEQALTAAPAEPAPSGGESDIRKQQDAAIEMSKGEQKTAPIRNRGKKVGRNDPCPCGSGKKYKNCHMNRDQGRMTA